MRILNTIALVILSSIFVKAQDQPSYIFDDPKQPKTTMAVDHETFNWGSIKEGEKVKVVFTVTNTGTSPLIISNAKGSCGCTVPEWPKDAIGPGKSAKVTAVFDSKGKGLGEHAKKVTITANTDPLDSYLTIQGFIKEGGSEAVAENRKSLERISDDLFTISPNPAIDHIDIKYVGKSKMDIAIFNTAGVQMYSNKIDQDMSVDVSTFAGGLYTVLVRNDDRSHLAKHFVVSK